MQGDRNVAVGYNTLKVANPSGDVDTNNTAIGYEAGLAMTTGTGNTFLGANAGDACLDSVNNVAIGINALGADAVGENVAVGNNALLACTASNNTAVGSAAGKAVTSGSQNALLERCWFTVIGGAIVCGVSCFKSLLQQMVILRLVVMLGYLTGCNTL